MLRRLRSTLVLLAVLIGLGAYIYFVELKRPSASEAAAIKPTALAIAPETIERLTILAANGDTTALGKADGRWQLTAPVTADADEPAVSSIKRAVRRLEIDRVVDEEPSDLKQYGLDPPRAELTISTSGDRNPTRLLIGQKTVTGTGVYAKVASDSRVFLMAASLEETFNRSTFDLRDKSVLKVDQLTVDALEIAAPDHTIHLAKRDLEWDMKQPLQTKADVGIITGLMTKVTTGKIRSVVASEPTDLVTYGLDKPLYTLTMATAGSRALLHVGKPADESTTYARDASRPIVFTIDRSLADDLKKAPWEFRRKEIFEFQTFNARRIELTRDGQTTIYEKSTGTDKDMQERWRETSPNPRDTDPTKMDTALTKLSFLRAVTFVDPRRTRTGLESPAISVLVAYEQDGKKEERVKLTKVDSRPFAARDDWPDAATFESSAYAQLIEALDELKN